MAEFDLDNLPKALSEQERWQLQGTALIETATPVVAFNQNSCEGQFLNWSEYSLA